MGKDMADLILDLNSRLFTVPSDKSVTFQARIHHNKVYSLKLGRDVALGKGMLHLGWMEASFESGKLERFRLLCTRPPQYVGGVGGHPVSTSGNLLSDDVMARFRATPFDWLTIGNEPNPQSDIGVMWGTYRFWFLMNQLAPLKAVKPTESYSNFKTTTKTMIVSTFTDDRVLEVV
jgi:hypothetical protein